MHLPCVQKVLKTNVSVMCSGQVWVHAEMDSAGRIAFAADSDSELTRGLAAVLVKALSGLTPEQVLQVCCCCTHWDEALKRFLL